MGGGSDTKPLRQEDYQAMAERARRAEAELAKLKGQKNPINYRTLAICAAAFVAAGAVVEVVFHLAAKDWHDHALPHSQYLPAQPEQKYPCYFTAQFHNPNHYEDTPLPWYHWYVAKSIAKNKGNGCVTDDKDDCFSFPSKDAAWQFIKGWGMEACK